jgi:PAS domain S-box-containing protein
MGRAKSERDAQGRPTFLIGACTDITRRKRAEETVRESEERFRTLVSVITDVPWTTDAEGQFVTPQPAWEAYTGQTWEEMCEFGWAEALHPDDRARVHELWTRTCQERKLYESSGRFWHAATKTYRYFEARATPVLNQDGSVREWVGTCTDVEEQKRFDAALQSLNSDLKHFSFATSHDLQEPLRMVTSYTQLLAKEYKGRLDSRADEFIAYAVDGAQRMEALLMDLREYWSVSERKIEKLIPIDCNGVLERALVYLEVSIQESGAAVTHDSLPTVMAEGVPLTLLFQNLIGNAIKYHRPETPPHIHVSAQRSAAEWRISVADNGIGIQAKHQEAIFAPFRRLHGREVPGTGIGLAMCQKIVERYRGRIWVESTFGQGSTFHFTMPAHGGET